MRGAVDSAPSNRVTPTLGAVATMSEECAATPFPFHAKCRCEVGACEFACVPR